MNEIKTTITNWLESTELAAQAEKNGSLKASFEKIWPELEGHIEVLKQQAVSQAMETIVRQLLQSDQPISQQINRALSETMDVSEAPSQSMVAEPAASGDLPWVESRLCTACDECISINKSIFAYNDQKQAYIKDPKGGPFRDIVKSAEKCSARIIHPGTPLNPKEKGIDKWIKRAEKYQ